MLITTRCEKVIFWWNTKTFWCDFSDS